MLYQLDRETFIFNGFLRKLLTMNCKSLVAIAANNEKGTPPTLPLPTANLGCERDLLLILVDFPRFKGIFRRAVGQLLLGISQRRFYIMKA